MQNYIKLLRLHQWVKNIFLFLPVFFAAQFSFSGFATLFFGFLAFSLTASAIYILNDYFDVESDRLHPEKCKRPIASGAISGNSALMFSAGILLLVLVPTLFFHAGFGGILLLYFTLNALYSFKLKHIPILDISIIAVGFVLRILAGGLLANVFISKWIILMTALLALFLGLAKRRDDVLLFQQKGEKMRKSVDGYNMEFINASMTLMAAVVVVAYIMYTTSEDVLRRVGSDDLYITTFPVILGLLRYLQITFVEQRSGSPTKILLHDRFLQIIIAVWMAFFYYFLYIHKH